MIEKKILWLDATPDQLMTFAAQFLGITSWGHNIGEEKVRARIRAAFTGDTITIMVPEEVAAVASAAPADASATPADASEADAHQEAASAAVDASDPALKADNRALIGTSGRDDPVVMLTISEAEGKSGTRPVFLSVNGVGILIPRGKMVPVAYRYYEVLEHAERTTYEQDEESGEIIPSNVKSYPFGVNQMPPQVEIDAYFAAQQ